MSDIPKIFIAYSRKDESFLEELFLHLRPLERSMKAEISYDGKIEAGVNWEQNIKDLMFEADIILLLVSADLLASDYLFNKTMKDTFELHEKGAVRIVPIIVRPCLWEATQLRNLKVAPRGGKPVARWVEKDVAYTDVVKLILEIIKDIESQKLSQDSTSFYIKTIELENIKCFKNRTKIDFCKDKDSKKISNWTLILGDNGSGKTTVLKSIYLALADDFYLGKEENFSRYARDPAKQAFIKSTICRNWDTDSEITGESSRIRRASFLREYNIKIEGHSVRRSRKRVPVFAYGATRKSVGNYGNDRQSKDEFGLNLFDENASLVSAEEWILEADYTDRINQQRFNSRNVIELLKKLFKGIISDIRIVSNKKIPIVEFQTKYGWVELNQLSLGYKTMISWLVDLLYKLDYYYNKEGDLFNQHAIVLIDEIDLHLHVTFQKKLVNFLTSTFKNFQFIVTAHSPLVVQASSNTNIILLKRIGAQSKAFKNNLDISKWRIDQIYSSDLFGRVNSRQDEINKLIKKKSELLLKEELTEEETNQLKVIDKEIKDIPVGYSPFEMEAIQLLKDVAKIYKK